MMQRGQRCCSIACSRTHYESLLNLLRLSRVLLYHVCLKHSGEITKFSLIIRVQPLSIGLIAVWAQNSCVIDRYRSLGGTLQAWRHKVTLVQTGQWVSLAIGWRLCCRIGDSWLMFWSESLVRWPDNLEFREVNFFVNSLLIVWREKSFQMRGFYIAYLNLLS